jgi:hypothetical protein
MVTPSQRGGAVVVVFRNNLDGDAIGLLALQIAGVKNIPQSLSDGDVPKADSVSPLCVLLHLPLKEITDRRDDSFGLIEPVQMAGVGNQMQA